MSRRMFKDVVTLLFFFSIFGSILLTSCAYTPQPLRPFLKPETAPKGIEVGMRCPNIRFQDEQGQKKELEDFRGKVVFMHFWGSWCVICQREMPSIQKLYDELKNEKGIAFLLLTTPKDSDESKRWAKALDYSLPLYFPLPGARPLLNLSTIPRTLILDRNGVVIMSKTGAENWNYWLEHIRDLIRISAITTQRHLSFPADGVRVEVEVEEGKPNSSLRLSFVTENSVKMSAKRGIDIRPERNSSVRWITPIPVIRIDESTDYFTNTPELTLVFESPASPGAVSLMIEYGYCKANSEECVSAKTVIKVPIYSQN